MLNRRFIHCTSTADAVTKILKNGFLIHSCKRKVLQQLTDCPVFKDEEPQEFGMVCLHNFRCWPEPKYWRKYGPYALEMQPSFVEKKRFRKVEYISYRGKRFTKLKLQMEDAIHELQACIDRKYPEDSFRHMAYTNSSIARLLGANKWVKFLSDFEYMEPAEHQFEHEWRYSRQEPVYNTNTTNEMINKINDPNIFAKYWNLLEFDRKDVLRLHAPADQVTSLRNNLPANFSDIEICSRLARVADFLHRA